jgi:conjugative transfer signal peptidase TraF
VTPGAGAGSTGRLSVLHAILREWWVAVSLPAVLVLGLGVLAGLRVNVSRSLPLGVYRIIGDASLARRGSVVIVCLPSEWEKFALQRGILQPGHCEGGGFGLGKIVVGIPGDVIEFSEDGIAVNGAPIRNSNPLKWDGQGRGMPHYPWNSYTLKADELWLFSPYHPAAFDSRYFGPVSNAHVQGVARPLWTGSWIASPSQ